jgi:hypothetical protein
MGTAKRTTEGRGSQDGGGAEKSPRHLSLLNTYQMDEPIVLAGFISLDTTFRAQVEAKLGRVGDVRKIKRK